MFCVNIDFIREICFFKKKKWATNKWVIILARTCSLIVHSEFSNHYYTIAAITQVIGSLSQTTEYVKGWRKLYSAVLSFFTSLFFSLIFFFSNKSFVPEWTCRLGLSSFVDPFSVQADFNKRGGINENTSLIARVVLQDSHIGLYI